jgi:hypothetical protein
MNLPDSVASLESRRDFPKIAQRFSAGIAAKSRQSRRDDRLLTKKNRPEIIRKPYLVHSRHVTES